MTTTRTLWSGRAAGRSCLSGSVGNALHFSWLRSMPAKALTSAIHFYRRFLSPLLPPGCRFQPTCSVYALDAIAAHGAGRGTILAIRRLLRCHPITWLGGSSGFDPVPPAKSQQS